MITQSMLKEIFEYDPTDGWFVYRITRGPRAQIGTLAGSFDKDGYVVIQIDGAKYKAHRLAFLYMTGNWPENEVDHKDGTPWNNAWENLREATRNHNVVNSNRPAGESGFRGVKFDYRSHSWRARIGYGGDRQYLGPFSTAEEAYSAYLAAAENIHGDFALHKRTN